jgi:hypothetical protein
MNNLHPSAEFGMKFPGVPILVFSQAFLDPCPETLNLPGSFYRNPQYNH